MVLVGSWLGEDFDAAVTQLVVFGRKRILIDADLADGRFRRELTGRETVNVHLPAIRPGRRSGQRLQIGLQLIGIVGKSLELCARNDDGSGVVGGIHIDGRGGVGDLNFLSLHFNRHGDVKAKRLVGNGDIFVLIERESLSRDGERVLSCR